MTQLHIYFAGNNWYSYDDKQTLIRCLSKLINKNCVMSHSKECDMIVHLPSCPFDKFMTLITMPNKPNCNFKLYWDQTITFGALDDRKECENRENIGNLRGFFVMYYTWP